MILFKKLIFSLIFFIPSFLIAQNRLGVVIVPVADVRSVSGTFLTAPVYDSQQETQLIYGEVVKIISESGDWVRIEAIEQQEYSHHNRWEGYPGWIQKNAVKKINQIPKNDFVIKNETAPLFSRPDSSSQENLLIPLGARMKGSKKYVNGFRNVTDAMGQNKWIQENDFEYSKSLLDEYELRTNIVTIAEKFLGHPYLWGGRSPYISQSTNIITGVDCSGLANLSYRVAGIDIPRDALEQFMKARRIKRKYLKKGDLIFIASKESPGKISHVSIFIDPSAIIEAPQTGEKVRKISFENKFGVPFNKIEDAGIVGDRITYFGTYFLPIQSK